MDLNKFFNMDENEKPLENSAADGGYVGIFRKIAIVGDSLASGEHESKDLDTIEGYHDFFDYSWGQYIARLAGTTVLNFTRGGMSTKEYTESFARNMGYWDIDKAAQCYIIALGVNDLINMNMEVGSVDDICDEDLHRNKPTFMGCYAKIIQQYKRISPDAKFFLVTMCHERYDDDRPERDVLRKKHVQAMYDLAEHFENCYVIDLYNYSPDHDEKFRDMFYTGFHLNALGYELMGRMIVSYMDYIIRHNPLDFNQAGFIGTPYKYVKQ